MYLFHMCLDINYIEITQKINMEVLTFDGRYVLWSMSERGHKNISLYHMTVYFKDLVDGYNQVKNETSKTVIYDAMVKYAYSYHPGYVCYDMDMYVALYKCAKTSEQRKRVMEHIYDIVADDFQYRDELIQNFKEFTQMKEFLNENDVEEFDVICIKALDFFEKQKKESEFETFAGQADFIPNVPLSKAREELKEVAEIIVSTGMNNLESYQNAQLVLGH